MRVSVVMEEQEASQDLSASEIESFDNGRKFENGYNAVNSKS